MFSFNIFAGISFLLYQTSLISSTGISFDLSEVILFNLQNVFQERRNAHGCIQGGENAELHRHVKSPSAGQGAVAEGEGTAVPDVVAAGGLGLHHQGAGLHL